MNPSKSRRLPSIESLEKRIFLHGAEAHHHHEEVEEALESPAIVEPQEVAPAPAVTTDPAADVASFVDSHLTYNAVDGKWRDGKGRVVTGPTMPKKPAAAGGSVGGSVAAYNGTPSTYTTGAKKILIIRVRFYDQYQGNSAYEPQSLNSTNTMLSELNTFLTKNSFGATSVNLANSVVTPVYTFLNTAAWYSTNDTGGIATNVRVDAMALAANPLNAIGYSAANSGLAAFDYSQFDQYAVRYNGGPGGFSGQAYVGGTGTWLKNGSSGVAAHEFGHNLGLWHANAWVPSTPVTVIGPGSNNEYGEGLDTMGGAGGNNNAFNAYQKWYLGWLSNANITTATSSGVYRVYAHDLGGSMQSGISYALRTTRDADRDYWISVRQSLTGNQWLMNGVQLHWDPWANSAGGSTILDTTPLSTNGVDDAGITLGRTFDDANGFHFTVLSKGSSTFGSVTLPYFDLQLNLGTYADDQSPTTTLSASATTVAVNAAINFTATATDPDGDPLAYAWDFGDKSVGLNAANVTKAWSAAGDYRVRVTVSDMKGRSYSTSLIVRVGTPTNIGRISGVALDPNGQPVGDVLVTNGLNLDNVNYRYTYTDSNGTYSLVGLTVGNSYTVNAYKAAYSLTAQFINPVSAGLSTTNINFVGTESLYKITGKVTDATGANVRGVLISDGSRTEVTDSNGNYTFWATRLGGYTLSATKVGYQFATSGFTNPVSINYGDATNINFSEAMYTVSGQITGVSSAAGLSVTDGIRSATVFRNGNGANATYQYFLTLPVGTWNLRVIDTNATPGSYTPNFTNPVVVSTAGVTSKDFSKDAATRYSATGRVTDQGDGLGGATVTIGSFSGTTDVRGYYFIQGLNNGSYTASVTKSGYTFTPATRSVTINSANAAAGDFATTQTNPPPTVVTPAAATPNPVTGKSVNLSVLGGDNDTEPYLLYTWSTTSAPGGASTTYSANASNSAKNTTATLTRAGTYVFRVTIRDVYNATVTSDVTVVVNQTATGVAISPASATVASGSTQQFAATMLDQFGQVFAAQPVFTWSVDGGTITSGGLYTATTFGVFNVTATSGAFSTTTTVSTVYPQGTGTGILREWWDGVNGSAVANLTTVLNAGTAATGSQVINNTNGGYFEIPADRANNYGTRLRGYYIAPSTGTYFFYIASDDASELWMNVNGTDPAGKTKIAEVTSFTSAREWTKLASQKSAGINLVAGQRYYIEALHKEGSGSDHLAVRADLPGNVSEAPIPYHRLDPFVLSAPTGTPALLNAAAVSGSQINLSWSYSGSGHTGFKIDRASDSNFTQNLTTINVSGASTTTYSNAGLAAGTTFYFRVRATNAIGDSGDSNTLSATTTGANQAPTVAVAAAASPGTVTATTTLLTVTGADDGGEASLTYTWATTGTPPAGVTFSANASNAAKSTTATFTKAGTYNFQVTISDLGGLSVTSSVSVLVEQTLSSLAVSPLVATVANGATQQFTATGTDQFGAAFVGAIGSVTWSLLSGSPGTISAAGLYSAPISGGGAATVKATSGALSGQAQITAGNVLFADNFEAGLTQWNATSGGAGAFTAVNDGTKRYQSAHTNTSLINRSTAGNLAWSNYILQATYKVTDNSLGGNASLMARVQDDSHWYGFTFDKTASKWKVYYKNGNNTVDLLASATSTLTTNTDYTLRVEVQGTALRFYVNNVLQVSTSDTQYATGKIGWTSFQTTATIDNVVVLPFNAAPTVAVPASASPSPVTGTTAALSVTGADDAGAANLTYTWAVLTKPQAASAPTFSLNSSALARESVATFTSAGSYSLQVTITDGGGLSVTSTVAVVVQQTLTRLAVSPLSATLAQGATQQFTAAAFDQFDQAMSTPGNLAWSLQAGSAGTVSTDGLYTAPTTGTAASAVVEAASGVVTTTASVSVLPSAPSLLTRQINDGHLQRSMINSFTYVFTSAVTIDAGAFTLLRQGEPDTYTVTATGSQDGKTWVLTFAGTGVIGGSLADGIYDLSIDRTKVRDVFGQQLSPAGASKLTFHRLFGDQNGDGGVDSIDALRFKQAEGSEEGGTAYKWWFDFNADGGIDSIDALRFKQREGKEFLYEP